jgi:CheY-like chemotaxis protein
MRSVRDDLFPISSLHENPTPQYFLHFAVKDAGRGLTDAEKKLLFKRFSQASSRTHVQYGGSGLGLFISRELTELQGGEIGVASESGVGSTFAFYIRTQKTSSPEDKVVIPKIPNEPADKIASKLPITVLVVEDNLINQVVLSKQLRNLGSMVYVANHGMEALDFLRTTKHWKNNAGHGTDLEVILLDIEMPVMDGLTCARKIRELQREGEIIGHVPIIAVSANARSEQIVAAKAAGMVRMIISLLYSLSSLFLRPMAFLNQQYAVFLKLKYSFVPLVIQDEIWQTVSSKTSS